MSGTLATDRLDLSPLLGTLSQVKASDGAWSRDLVELGLLPTGDLDIRLSAGTVIAGSATLTNAAFTILARGGRTDIAIGNAEFLQGTVKGRVSITTNGQAGLDLKLNTTHGTCGCGQRHRRHGSCVAAREPDRPICRFNSDTGRVTDGADADGRQGQPEPEAR